MKTIKFTYHLLLASYHVRFKDKYNMNEHPTVMKYHYEKATYHHNKCIEIEPKWLKSRSK